MVKTNTNNTLNKYVVFYFISFFMLTNGGLFSFLAQQTIFTFWRQIIWLFGLIIMYKFYSKYGRTILDRKICMFIIVSFLGLTFLSCYTLFSHGYNYTRIFYSWWLYLAGVPFFIFPRVYAASRKDIRSFYKYFCFLGLFTSVGLVFDSQTTWFKFIQVGLYDIGDSIDFLIEGENRASFLSETTTTFCISYSFCLLSDLYLMSKTSKLIKKIFYFICSLLCLIGGWYTGSRQIFLLMLLLFVGGVIIYLLFVKDKKKKTLLLPLICILLLGFFIVPFLFSNEQLSQRYTINSINEDTRSNKWINGFNDTFQKDVKTILFGNGVAYASGQRMLPGESLGSHYENTYFYRMNEIGLFGIYILIFPCVLIIGYLKRFKIKFLDCLVLLLMLNFIIVSYVSPNGSSPTTLSVMFLLAGLYVCRNSFELDYE